MANLAIKGHETRGKEVIKILEMLGGTNVYHHRGGDNCVGYTVEGNEIRNIHYIFGDEDFIFFTLEEFLEKYPYKVGDKVRIPDYESEVRIDDMNWDGHEIQYNVFSDESEWYSAKELNRFNEPYKEQESMEEQKLIPPYMDYDVRTSKEGTIENKQFTDMLDTLSSYLGDILTPKGVEKAIKYIRENMEEYSKPQYPKTYEECCEVLRCNIGITMKLGIEEDEKLFSLFYMLKTCRNAYWKLYGEQTGLGKPWEPVWKDDNTKYIITFAQNEVYKDVSFIFNYILAFPTEEMRDAFYENFKELIETCKEFL